MSNSVKLISLADGVYAKYRFEIDGRFSASKFFKAKFESDREFTNKLVSNLYKKIK